MKNQFAMTEIMNFELSGLPKSRRGMDKYADREGWDYVEVPSTGKGGVRREYVLPVELFEMVKLQALQKLADEAVIPDVAKSASSELTTTTNSAVANAALLADWQRKCAIARLTIVRYVLQAAELTGKTKAIEAFAKASKEKRLDDALIATIKRANAKSGGADSSTEGRGNVSRRTLFDWIKAFEISEADSNASAASDYGIPAIFYVDNGSGYKNKMMKDESSGLMTRMGVEVRHSIAYNSQARGAIERVHKTIWIRLARKLPTYIGVDMDRQAKQTVYKKTRKDIKEFGESKALIGWDEFLQLARDAVIAYNHEPHSSLPRRHNPITGRREHLTPQIMWDEQVTAMDNAGTGLVTVSDYERDDLYRPYIERKCLRGEINLFSNKYFSRELEQYHGETMLVGYDIRDGSRVWVRDMTHRLITIAEFEGNKKGYFSQSALGDAREQRAIGQVKRAQVHVDAALENMRPHQVLEHVESQMMPMADIERAQNLLNERLAMEDAQVVEIKDDAKPMQATFDRFNALDSQDKPAGYASDNAAPPPYEPQPTPRKLKYSEMSQDERFSYWLALDAKRKTGDELAAEDEVFYEAYPDSNIFKIKMREYQAAHEAEHGTKVFFKLG